MNTPIEYALAYAAIGWRIFPVHSMRDGVCSCPKGKNCPEKQRGKHPRISNNLKLATTDTDTLSKWWRRWPNANIGCATGLESGIWVLDVDPRNKSEQSIEELGEFDYAVRQETGGGDGGEHFFFAWDPEHPVGSRSNVMPGLDCRGEGGYVILPPSNHKSGGNYLWDSECDPLDGAVPGAASKELLAVFATTPSAAPTKPAPTTPPATTITVNLNTGTQHDADRVREALKHVPADNRETWIRHGMILKRSFEDALGRELWDEWSKTSDTFDAEDQSRVWASFKDPENGVKPLELGSLFADARECGFVLRGSEEYAGPDEGDEDALFFRGRLTDSGNAERLVKMYGDRFRFCSPQGKWFVWNGRIWELDHKKRLLRGTKDVAREIWRAGLRFHEGSEKPNAITKWGTRSEEAARRNAMIALAAAEPGIAIMPDDLDRSPFLLTCRNGTVDLRTGVLQGHKLADLITKESPAKFDPEAACPTWDKFLERVIPNPDVRNFLHRALGYTCTGLVSEQCLFFLLGGGANGKSTFLTAIQSVLGSGHAIQAAPDLLLATHQKAHPTELASLWGVRMAVTSEIGSGRKFDEVAVKQLTGGDLISARRMREDFWQFAPTHKLWIGANHRPIIEGTDYAIWRRINLVDFSETIPVAERDPDLPRELAKEADGILAWLVRGAVAYFGEGLAAPESVLAATREYRTEQDVFGRFLDECTTPDPQGSVRSNWLYAAYKQWCTAEGEFARTATAFGKALTARKITRRKVKGGFVAYFGIGLMRPGSPIPEGSGALGGFSPFLSARHLGSPSYNEYKKEQGEPSQRGRPSPDDESSDWTEGL